MLLDGLKQADARVAEKTAELGIDFQLAAQTMCNLFHFVAFATLCCRVYNDSVVPGVFIENLRFPALRYG